ncbi:MAG: protein translocase subunit SecD, partial [Veillonella caviae]|nr:protein translocase subunit SecD [Veillonella caviae]
MNSKAVAKFLAAIAIIIGVFIYFIGPLAESIKQGLDLQGGTHIVLEAEDSGDNKVTDDAVDRVIQILSRRINEMGLTEPLIQREGKKRIIIELPGVKDPDEAIKTIGKTAVMEFR